MQRFIILILCALLTNSAVAPVAWSVDPVSLNPENEVLNEARKLMEAGDYTSAKELLLDADARDPGNADILNLLGFICRQAELYADAATYYARALEADPNHKGALEYQGELYLLLDRPEKAKANLARLVELCAAGCEEREELAEAIAAYQQAN